MRRFGLVASGVVLLGCAGIFGDKKGGTDTTSSSDSGISQDPDCKDYMRCLSVVDTTTFAASQSTYGSSGTCWDTTQAVADECGVACASGLSAMHQLYPDEAACDDGSPVYGGDWIFVSTGSVSGDCDSELGLQAEELEFDVTMATGGSGILMDGDSDLYVDGFGELADYLSFDCAGSGSDFTCDTYGGGYDVYYTFSGTFSGSTADAQMDVGIGDGTGTLLCTDTTDMYGEK